MTDRRTVAFLALGICLACGLIISSYFLSSAIKEIKMAERYVTVKGLSERIVEADLAIWSISFRNSANDLEELQRSIDDNKTKLYNFLLESGFPESEISSMPPQITDTQALPYYDAGKGREYRYVAVTRVTLRSGDVANVKKAMEKAGQLVSAGIAIGEDSSTRFSFTKLNDIKPEMIAEATKNAREAAEQFARDSGSEVGAIRRATQGYFTIEDRDAGSPDFKIVRVVTTIDFFLSSH